MKKIILSAIAILTIGFANAQSKGTSEGFAKGDVFVTGGFSFNNTTDNATDVKTNRFEIAPQVNYFVTENISLGAKVGYGSFKQKNATTDLQDVSALTFGVQGRYYFTPASKFSLFTGLGFDYSSITYNLANPKYKENGFNVGLGLGLNYFVSENWGIEASFAGLSYGTSKSDASGAKSTDTFSLGGNLSAVTFGVNYKF
jgi:outer membrane protein